MYLFLKRVLAIAFLFFTMLSNIVSNLNVYTQNNQIQLSIPYIEKDGKKIETSNQGNSNWNYKEELNSNDKIRYGWQGVAIDLSYKSNPTPGGGWIKVYLEDENIESNAIIDNGTSPLELKTIDDKLKNGKNKIILVFVDDTNDPKLSKSKSSIIINYKKNLPDASLEIITPPANSILSKNIQREFKIQLKNFSLVNSVENKNTEGKLNIFLNEVKQPPLAIITTSKESTGGGQVVEFNSSIFNPEVNIEDSKNQKFIFQLVKNNGDEVLKTERTFITNYSESLTDLGLPSIKFTEPKADRVDLSVDGERKFIVEVNNFELLQQLTSGANEDKKGYLQIFVDDQPIKRIWGEKEFTLNSINYVEKNQGKRVIYVQLVNKDFTKLTPEVSANLDVIYIPNNQNSNQNSNEESIIENNNWRVYLTAFIVVVILTGIVVVIIKA